MNHPTVILTALNLEYQAVRDQLSDLSVHRHPAGTRFEVGTTRGGRCRVALGLVGKGNQSAAVLAERAIAVFTPAAVLFAGVAGSLWPNVGLGDLVVATHVYAYHGGTSGDNGLKARPRVWEISHGPDQIARHLARTGAWTTQSPPNDKAPTVHFGPIAAGEVVQDSAVSAHARWVRQHYNDALAIEMEAAGVAQAAHLNNALPVVVVRGISDMADGTKPVTDERRWQPRAAHHAATFAVALAEAMHTEPRPATHAQPRRDADMSQPTTLNVAQGHAHVGVQAGQVHGGIRIGADTPAPIDLAAQIADLREELNRANDTGDVDDSTYHAAEHELGVITGHLGNPTPQGTNRVVLALKRLRGLLADVAQLAEKVAAILAAIRSIR